MRHYFSIALIFFVLTNAYTVSPGSNIRDTVYNNLFTIESSIDNFPSNDVVRIEISDLVIRLKQDRPINGWIQWRAGNTSSVTIDMTINIHRDRAPELIHNFERDALASSLKTIAIRLFNQRNEEVRRYEFANCIYVELEPFIWSTGYSETTQNKMVQRDQYDISGRPDTLMLTMSCSRVQIIATMNSANTRNSWSSITGGGVKLARQLRQIKREAPRREIRPREISQREAPRLNTNAQLQFTDLTLKGSVKSSNSATLSAMYQPIGQNDQRNRDLVLTGYKDDGVNAYSVTYMNVFLTRYVFPILDRRMSEQLAEEELFIRANNSTLLRESLSADPISKVKVEVQVR